jgi:alanyl-tRNA synthetase
MTQRLYYDDATLLEFTATVTDVRERRRENGKTLWDISLDRSAFYPTSGGQPFDTGTLRAVARSGATLDAEIIDVSDDDAGEVWHLTAKPLNSGTQVTGFINVTRRRDHMQQHTGQHLLSAIFQRELNAVTISFHLGDESSSIDLAAENIEALLAPENIARVESIANTVIAESRAVTLRTVTHEVAESLLAAGKLRKLPPRTGDIRMVEIADLDLNACGGTHVSATGEIGALLIRRVEKARGGMRVEFLCGARAIAHSRREFLQLTESAALLSSSFAQLAENIEKLLANSKSAARESWKLLEQLAAYHAAELLQSAEVNGNLRIVHATLADRDMEYIKLLGSKIVASSSNTAAMIFSTQSEPASFVLASSAASLHAGNILRAALTTLSLRGGGSATLAQCAVPAIQIAELRRLLEAAVTQSVNPV